MTLEQVKLEDLQFPSCQLIQFPFYCQTVNFLHYVYNSSFYKFSSDPWA